ncbi:MAG TPA: hypothetical protein ENK63_03405 [Rhodobacterales bacterium]|nr:hypothetical protein [Rhodobacterales bacterium]
MTGDVGGIVRTDPEAYQRPDITKEGVEDLGLDLVEVLVCQREREAVFAHLGDHVGQGASCEGVELVDVEEKRAAVRREVHRNFASITPYLQPAGEHETLERLELRVELASDEELNNRSYPDPFNDI